MAPELKLIRCVDWYQTFGPCIKSFTVLHYS